MGTKSEGKYFYFFYHIYSLTTYILLQHIFSYITLHKLFYIFYHNIFSYINLTKPLFSPYITFSCI